MADLETTVETTQPTENEKTETLDSLKLELEKLRAENGKLKNAQSNASADASKWKKQLQERMSEQERAENATKELIDSLKSENERLKRDQEVASRTAAYVGVGFDESLAKKAAEAYGSDHNGFMDALKAFITAHDKALQADSLRSTPRPGNGAVAPAVTKEQFDKMKYTERAKLYEEQPELYKELIK